MTRRGAIIGAMLLGAGKLIAQDRQKSEMVTLSDALAKLPRDLSFTFGGAYGFKNLIVKFGDGSSVTLTEADIKRELTHTHTAQRWGNDSLFMVNGRRLEVCAECGETFWAPPQAEKGE